jgi:acetylornithine deacetylase/succinyl-diaminopimelate desuccinylase-like protein
VNNPVLSKAQALNTKTADFLAELASIASLSGREEKIVACLKKEMEAIGFDEIIIDGLGNIIGRIGNGSIKVAFDALIDMVDVGNRNLWKFNPLDGHVKDAQGLGARRGRYRKAAWHPC